MTFNEFRKYVLAGMVIGGFLFQIGTVGALENDIIDIPQALVQMIICGGVMFGAMKGLDLI